MFLKICQIYRKATCTWAFFLIKLQSCKLKVCNFKNETPAQVFPVNFAKFNNTCFFRTIRVAASGSASRDQQLKVPASYADETEGLFVGLLYSLWLWFLELLILWFMFSVVLRFEKSRFNCVSNKGIKYQI